VSIIIHYICWQVGGTEEYKIVEAVKSKRITKPVVAWCIGTCAKMFTSEVCHINDGFGDKLCGE